MIVSAHITERFFPQFKENLRAKLVSAKQQCRPNITGIFWSTKSAKLFKMASKHDYICVLYYIYIYVYNMYCYICTMINVTKIQITHFDIIIGSNYV